MNFWKKVLEIIDRDMPVPEPFEWFHLLFVALSIAAAVILVLTQKPGDFDRTRRVVFITAVIVTVLEIYKQINFSFSYSGENIEFNFQWYAFPYQFCSLPMYVGLLSGCFKKGRILDSLLAFLATYAIFGGICVMAYPVQVFVPTIGINVQTMFCHGSMITIGAYLLATGAVRLEHKTIFKALPVFGVAVTLAVIMNEAAYYTGLLETHTFNMFFISRHCEPSLPVYSLVQAVVPYPFCLIIYIIGFTLAAYAMLLIAMGINRIMNFVNQGRKKANV